ncbi:MAG: putative baseplate assembly protein [Pirellulaceae bacterium]
MNSVWWGKESINGRPTGQTETPQLFSAGRLAIRHDVASRINGFVPEWTKVREGDAGFALLKLHAELAEPVIQRLNRLPEKTLIEFLRTANISVTPPRPARAMLAFKTSDAAPRSVFVPKGFQVLASSADSSGTPVVFETERGLHATPGSIQLSLVQEGSHSFEIDLSGSDLATARLPFGAQAKAGAALLLGLNTSILPQPSLSIGIQLSNALAPPQAYGGIETTDSLPRPVLRWEFFDGGSFETAEVINDETRSLQQSGVVELRSPKRWRPGTPAGVTAAQPLRWLRIRIAFGEFVNPPMIAFVRLNLVAASAVRTIRNEVLEFIPDANGRRMRLSQKPILNGSLKLTVAEGVIAASSRSTSSSNTPSEAVLWQQVDDLNAYGADDRVYVLDSVNGELEFGDGIHGAILPHGFRHVVAESYQISTGAAGAVDANQISGLISSVPFLASVTNPIPSSGGRNQENLEQAIQRGTQKIRARGRAVTTADFGLLAMQANGADVSRAHAVGGINARFNDAHVPGTVTVFLLGPPQAEGPPYPDQGTLEAVGRYLCDHVAPAGVEIVTASPRFHRLGVRASLVVSAGAESGRIVRQALAELDGFLDPIHGGELGAGWPFGGAVLQDAIVRRLLSQIDGLQAVSRLNLVVDGEMQPSCTDFLPLPNHLIWPDTHELWVVEEVRS